MKRPTYILLILVLFCAALPPVTSRAAPLAGVIPTLTAISVVPDVSVTILTFNFPAHDTFEVLMGPIGTRGVNGIRVATLNSGSGGSFTATFTIPTALQGYYQIAIRLQSTSGSGYFAYNWFYNDFGGGGSWSPLPPGYPDIPTFNITGIVRDVSVTITTDNFPAHDTFDVLMGYMGTRGVNGILVDQVNSGAGGTLTWTFNIPPALQGRYQVAIRLQSNSGSGYYAYNWFYNNTAGSSGGPILPPLPSPGYTGYPTFSIAGVVSDSSVTIVSYNLPPHKSFQVTMGPIGTRGIGGYIVDTFDSGDGGSQTLTFNTPPGLFGLHQIAIRLQSTDGSGYYAYNWFFNRTY
jgi:hypothetical protein